MSYSGEPNTNGEYAATNNAATSNVQAWQQDDAYLLMATRRTSTSASGPQMNYHNANLGVPPVYNLMPGSFERLSLQKMRQGIPNRPAENEMPYNAGALFRGTPPLSNQVQGDYTPVHQMSALEQARAQQRRLRQHGLEPMQMSYQIVNQGTAPAPRTALRNEEPVRRRPALLALPWIYPDEQVAEKAPNVSSHP